MLESFDDPGDLDYLTPTGIRMPRFFEPQSLSSKKDRERKNQNYIPPAPRPHARSVSSGSRMIHSRVNSHDLDTSFTFFQNASAGEGAVTYFGQFFEIQERLGFGSFGDVSRVISLIDGKQYAVKKSRNTYAGEGDRCRQLKEVQRVSKIPSNNHLVELEKAWEEGGHLYLQLELCSKSLNQHIEEGNYLTEQQAWDVLIDMLDALGHLHSHGLVHLDVKPDNIFLALDQPTMYKLGDFGIVVSLKEKADVTEFTEGDSRYLAPEVMQGTVSTKADVFSLGMTMLEISAHVDLPKQGNLWHRLRSGISFPLTSHNTPIVVPKSLENLIKYMIVPDLDLRPEIGELQRLPIVKKMKRQRQWALATNNIKRKLRNFKNLIFSFFFLFTSMFNFTWRKGQNPKLCTPVNVNRIEYSQNIPEIHVNDNSFSDDDLWIPKGKVETPPKYASTPISTTKRSSARLRSGHSSRQFGNGNYVPKPGSPTSRNLLKDFEAVSD